MLRVAAVAIAALFVTSTPQAVGANDSDGDRVPIVVAGTATGAEVWVTATSPGSAPDAKRPGGASSSGPVGEWSDRTGVSQSCSRGGAEIPCHVGGAYWSGKYGCYVRRADPQPADSSALWDGHRGADGKPVGEIHLCLAPGAPPVGYDSWYSAFWVPAGGSAEVVVDPAELAQRAVARMGLRAGELGATPLPGEGARSVVGLPTWLWVADVGESTWGPITRTATAGSVSVTATAAVSDVVYSMGDGGTVRCATPGTPWTAQAGATESPDCGYRYRDSGDFTIRAASNWKVDWHGGGQSGTITFTLRSQREIKVTELQVVVTR